MRTISRYSFLMALSFLPAIAMAHPGHDHTHSGFWAGFIHPFTGLDHLIMAVGFGVLLWTMTKQWKILGIVGLSLSLVFGFILGAQQMIPATLAEYGIIASLIVLAVALWSKSYRVLPFAALLMASFHGIAHGVELAPQGYVIALVIGMICGMGVLYAVGLALGALIQRHIPYGRKVISGAAAVVAVIGLG